METRFIIPFDIRERSGVGGGGNRRGDFVWRLDVSVIFLSFYSEPKYSFT